MGVAASQVFGSYSLRVDETATLAAASACASAAVWQRALEAAPLAAKNAALAACAQAACWRQAQRLLRTVEQPDVLSWLAPGGCMESR